MEITLQKPTLQWRLHQQQQQQHQQRHEKPDDLPTAEHVHCTVALEQKQSHQLPCALQLPASDSEEYAAFLAQHVTFSVFSKQPGNDGELLLSEQTLHLSKCVPVLTDGKVSWRELVKWKGTELELDVSVSVTTAREPRQLFKRLLLFKSCARFVTEQLSGHRKAVAIGLTPPILGCVFCVAVTSPVWVPLVLIIAILGFPIWCILALLLSLVIVFATISTLVAVQVARSERVRSETQKFLQGPHGQLLLFRGASPDEGKIKQLVMSDPKYKLLASVLIDFMGMATFVIPIIGELADLLWAPLATSMVSAMYSESLPNIKYVIFIEEVLPFTDIIPTATLAWMKENFSMSQARDLLATLLK